MKTIYITEAQKKKLKKAVAAQDQVGGKVNAGVMDGVVGMCENIEDDKYELGAEKGDISPYYHVNESNEETITLYHGVNRKGLEYNLEQGYFIPRVCSEGGPKAIWLSEKQYNYEFTFAFDIPKSEVEQLSNVDYIFTNKIGFNDFNCRLVRTSISSYFDDIVVETNILNDKLSKLHFRYFPDLGIELWKEFKQYPNILEKFINPYIEKYQQLSESINISKENRMVDINQVINSPEFKAWFGDSKVVDKNGNPLIVHHGSPKFEGDKFNKGKIGKSINQGEEGVFCTTQDMSWAKRFSYPATEGSLMFTVKIDDTKPGDILSGFLKLEHPLDFFNLSNNDIQNMFKMNIKYDEFGQAWVKKIGKKEYYKKFYNEIKQLINIGNHNLIKFYIHRNLGEALKEFGYDGYIALMKLGDSAIEYCFIEPNQFKSIYSFAFNPNSDSIYENKSNINTKEEKTNFGKVWYINAVDNSFRFALYKYDDDSNCLYLSNVFVEESSRRQGLGNYILNLTNDFAKKMNVKEIFLKVKKGTFMCKWYEKNGYEYFSDDETDSNYIWMVKEVKQNNIIENKKKVIKNDKGEIVPDKCDKCGGEVVLQIHGEPVYLCKDCGKYFGTMPFHLKENKLNENSNDRKINNYIKQKFGLTDFQDIRNKVMEVYKVVPYARIFSGRYLLGVFRLLFEDNIPRTDYTILNKILYIINHNWFKYGQHLDNNLNNLSINELINFVNLDVTLSPKLNYVEKTRKVKNGYTITHVDSFEEMDVLCDGEWCISHDEFTWDDIVSDETVYLVQNEQMIEDFDIDYEKNKEKWDEIFESIDYMDESDMGSFEHGGTPYDLYGLSRFVVLVSDYGISSCYSRYNIPNCLDGNFLNEKQLSELLGVNPKEAFPYVKPEELNENIELEIKPDEVDLSSFNIKKKLNPKFWIDGHLDSRIRLKLLDISDDFIEYLGIDPDIVKDVIMTGSLANFNWNEEFSDIDLHVLLDYSDVDENTEFVKQYFMSQKNLWNNEHQDLKIFGFPIEVYVQDINEKHDSSGVYSLDRDKWLREPDRDVLASSKVNKEFIRNKVSDYVNKIDKLLYIYKKAKNDEYKLRKLSEKVEKLWDEIKNNRKHGFEKSGGKEINNLNIVFKTLRRLGYLDKLYDLKTKTYDKLMSL